MFLFISPAIQKDNRIITTICKHIVADEALSGAGITVRINEPANLGVIVAALEIVEAGFGIVIVAAVAERVNLCEVTCCGNDFTIGVVIICRNLIAGSIDQIHYVALEIGNVIIGRCCRAVAIDQAIRISSVIVNKIQRSSRFALGDRFPQQIAARVDVLVDFLNFRWRCKRGSGGTRNGHFPW